jgi:hypothetical protein
MKKLLIILSLFIACSDKEDIVEPVELWEVECDRLNNDDYPLEIYPKEKNICVYFEEDGIYEYQGCWSAYDIAVFQDDVVCNSKDGKNISKPVDPKECEC